MERKGEGATEENKLRLITLTDWEQRENHTAMGALEKINQSSAPSIYPDRDRAQPATTRRRHSCLERARRRNGRQINSFARETQEG